MNTNGTDIKRAAGLIIVEVRNSNPNGDPERDGAPRRRRGDIGEISPVSVKRKMRDSWQTRKDQYGFTYKINSILMRLVFKS